MIRWVLLALISFQLYAEDLFDIEPVSAIEGPEAGLDRPEGIAFSPNGLQVAIASSEGARVTVYNRQITSLYSIIPSITIYSDEMLYYAHDLEYTPTGSHLAIACRETQNIVMLPIDGLMIGSEDPWIINGEPSLLADPADVAFAPDGQVMGVCNRLFGITFYQKVDGEFETTPSKTLDEAWFLKWGLSCPHALSFSPDGKDIAFTCKPYPKLKKAEGVAGIMVVGVDSDQPSYIMQAGDRCLHSIAYHPSGQIIAATDERYGVLLLKKTPNSTEFRVVQKIPIDKRGGLEGPKGVAFSPDGDLLAVTTVYDSVLFFRKL